MAISEEIGPRTDSLDQTNGQEPPLNGAQNGTITGDQATDLELTNADDQPGPEITTSLRRRVFSMAWPVIGENFLQTLMGIVDTLLVAKLGAEAIAGVGSALQIMFFVIAALSATSIGSSVLVAQSIGARQHGRANLYAKQSLLWSVLFSVPLIIIGWFFAEELIAVFGMEPEVSAIGAEYLRVTMGTVAVLTLMIISGGVLRGVSDSRTPMLVTLLANVINVVLTIGLIFGYFGLPELGVVGSAWGTFISRAIGFAVLAFVLWRGRNGVTIRGRIDWWPDLSAARRLLKIGAPAALEQLLITSGFLVMTIVVAQLGTLALAAHRIAFTALSLSFLPGIGFSIAATALVGQSIGARRQSEGGDIAKIATVWALVWMGVLGAIFFFFATPIMRLFTDDPLVVAIGAAGLRPVALTQPFWAILIVQSGALRGTGDTRFPMWVNAGGIWIAVLLGGGLALTFDGGLVMIWAAFLISAPTVAWIMTRRFRHTISRKDLAAAF